MDFGIDQDRTIECDCAPSIATSDMLYDPTDCYFTSTYPVALSRRLQHRLSETSQSSPSSDAANTISPHLLLQPPAVITVVSDVNADESSDDSSDGESDVVDFGDAALSPPSLPMLSAAPPTPDSPTVRNTSPCSVRNQSPSSPIAPPSTPETKPRTTAKRTFPYVRRSERMIRPASKVVLREPSPSGSDDAESGSDFVPEPATPAKRARRTTCRSSVPARAPPTPMSPPPRKWPKRVGEGRRSQNKEAQKKYRDRKKAKVAALEAELEVEKAKNEAISEFVDVLRCKLDSPSPSGPKVKKLRTEFSLYDRRMNAINGRFPSTPT